MIGRMETPFLRGTEKESKMKKDLTPSRACKKCGCAVEECEKEGCNK